MKWILAALVLVAGVMVAGASAISWTYSDDLALATLNLFDSYLSTFAVTYTPSCAWDCGQTSAKVIDSLKIENGNLLFRQRTLEHTPGRITVLNDTTWINAGSMQQ